ncbi:MAG: ABC transporter permease [Chitinophagaceae bacterium]|nr:ABC transporter permease [Chitinophagaceae bacterium]
MIYNYLKIAFRNLMKYKFISFINLFGLTVGLTCCLLITTYIIHETSYDRQNKKADNIYRVTRQFNAADGKVWLHLGTISPPFGPLLSNEYPEIQQLTRLLPFGNTPIRLGDKMFNEELVFVADDNLFNVFDVDVVRGNPKSALSNPFSIMLSEETARKYFGTADPLDKSLRLFNQYELKVTGVYKAFPSNAHMHPELLISFPTLKDSAIYGEEGLRTNWGNNSFFTYILLPDKYDAAKLEARFPAFLDKHFPRGPNSTSKPSQGTALFLQKLTDIHLRSHLDYEAEENGDIKRVYVFSAIALFILLIACINYMNLSTARSALRAREIGIRKVAGATRKEIILQFLAESIFISLLSTGIALLLCWLLLPVLNKLSGLEMTMDLLNSWKFIAMICFVPFVVGIFSGIYPALFMSSFRPVKVLKGLFKSNKSAFSFRQVLVVTQFSISIILIICTAIVFQQLKYIQSKSLGFDREHIVTVPYDGSITPQYEAFRTQLLSNALIADVGRSSRIPTGRLLDALDAKIPVGDSAEPVKADIKMLSADHNFITTYNIRMKAGRNFSREFGDDSSRFILNEAAVSAIGWKTPQEAVGKLFYYGGIKGTVIGVMNDMHFESLHETITPLVALMPTPQGGGYNQLSIKVAGKNIAGAMAHVEQTWKKFLPQSPFDYTFLDENFDNLYRAETVQGNLFTIFSCIAIFIACLGLFGLSAFTITQRIKEIGIRKVLGADTSTIVSLLSKDFMKLVLISAVVAFPIAWAAMYYWLQDFAYRRGIAWWVFIVAAVIAALVALITISFQAIKAALSNPVKSLRTE